MGRSTRHMMKKSMIERPGDDSSPPGRESVLRTLFGGVELSLLLGGDLGDLGRFFDSGVERCFHFGDCGVCAGGAGRGNSTHIDVSLKG